MTIYDVEAALANFEAAAAAEWNTIPDDAPPSMLIHSRNRAVSRELMRMALEEANKGTKVVHLMEASAGIVAEYLCNTVKIYDRPTQDALLDYFSGKMAIFIAATLSGVRSPDVIAAHVPTAKGAQA